MSSSTITPPSGEAGGPISNGVMHAAIPSSKTAIARVRRGSWQVKNEIYGINQVPHKKGKVTRMAKMVQHSDTVYLRLLVLSDSVSATYPAVRLAVT
jgi:hypothetical protein